MTLSLRDDGATLAAVDLLRAAHPLRYSLVKNKGEVCVQYVFGLLNTKNHLG